MTIAASITRFSATGRRFQAHILPAFTTTAAAAGTAQRGNRRRGRIEQSQTCAGRKGWARQEFRGEGLASIDGAQFRDGTISRSPRGFKTRSAKALQPEESSRPPQGHSASGAPPAKAHGVHSGACGTERIQRLRTSRIPRRAPDFFYVLATAVAPDHACA